MHSLGAHMGQGEQHTSMHSLGAHMGQGEHTGACVYGGTDTTGACVHASTDGAGECVSHLLACNRQRAACTVSDKHRPGDRAQTHYAVHQVGEVYCAGRAQQVHCGDGGECQEKARLVGEKVTLQARESGQQATGGVTADTPLQALRPSNRTSLCSISSCCRRQQAGRQPRQGEEGAGQAASRPFLPAAHGPSPWKQAE